MSKCLWSLVKLKEKLKGLNAKLSRSNILRDTDEIHICYFLSRGIWVRITYVAFSSLRQQELKKKKKKKMLFRGPNSNTEFSKVDRFFEMKAKLKCFTLFFSSMLQVKTDEKLNLSDGNTASCPLSPIKMCLNHPIEWNLKLTAASLASCTVHNQNLKSEEK